MTLGKLIKENPQIVPQPLNDVVTKIFGFASIKGVIFKKGMIRPMKKPNWSFICLLQYAHICVKWNFPQMYST